MSTQVQIGNEELEFDSSILSTKKKESVEESTPSQQMREVTLTYYQCKCGINALAGVPLCQKHPVTIKRMVYNDSPFKDGDEVISSLPDDIVIS